MEGFAKFKELNTIDALADGKIWIWKEVIKMSADEVYIKLVMNKTGAEYQKKYMKIMQRKAEREFKAKQKRR